MSITIHSTYTHLRCKYTCSCRSKHRSCSSWHIPSFSSEEWLLCISLFLLLVLLIHLYSFIKWVLWLNIKCGVGWYWITLLLKFLSTFFIKSFKFRFIKLNKVLPLPFLFLFSFKIGLQFLFKLFHLVFCLLLCFWILS